MIKTSLGLRLLPYTIIPITIYSILPYPKLVGNVVSDINNTTFWWLILFAILLTFWKAKRKFDYLNAKDFSVVSYYLFWNLVEIVYGVFVAETYWDWKGLVTNAFALLMPIIVYAGCAKPVLQQLLKRYFQYALPLFGIFALLITTDAYGFFLVPVSFMIFFFPILSFRWKVFIMLFASVVIFSNLGARSNVLKFTVPIVLLVVYYGRTWITLKQIEVGRIVLLLLPFFFFVLATTGLFNIFNISSYIKGSYTEKTTLVNGQEDDQDLTADTRTFLYVEVLQTAFKYNTWVFGRSPARGNETDWFAELSEITGRKERLSNEVAILNIFTWTGLVGVFFYFIVFYRASLLSIHRSNNIFSKMLGLYIAFRWSYAWVEDVNNFSLSNFFLWLMLGICLSKNFRQMTNQEVRIWILGTLHKRYRRNDVSIISYSKLT
jgi:hypothetical protein